MEASAHRDDPGLTCGWITPGLPVRARAAGVVALAAAGLAGLYDDRLETVTPSANGANATAAYDVWHPDYAYGMAALGTQRDGLGIGLAVGGGTVGYPQFAVGYKDDFVVYTVTASNATQTAPGVSRFGDYFSVRPIPESDGFAAEAYDVLQSTAGQTCVVGGCRAVARYVEFHRAPPG